MKGGSMQSIQTSHSFSLNEVKPLEKLMAYRDYCLTVYQQSLYQGVVRRRWSPIGSDLQLATWKKINDIEYLRCPRSGSLFLANLPPAPVWAKVLTEVSRYRASPAAFHHAMQQARLETVFKPKREWIENTLRLAGIKKPVAIDLRTSPVVWSDLLNQSGIFAKVIPIEEMDWTRHPADKQEPVDVAILFESLDRVDDPAALLKNVHKHLNKGGILFVTALVASGYDMVTLGEKNAYLYPPDRTNCFSLDGLKALLTQSGFELLEVSTPGILDVEVVKAHLKQNPELQLSPFERQIVAAQSEEVQKDFQAFLQKSSLSSFARIAARK